MILNQKKEMNNDEKLKYFNALTYNIILKKGNKSYSLIIPEISLFVVNDNLQDATEDLFRRKEMFFKDMISSGCEDDIALPRHLARKNELLSQLKIFMCKLLIVGLIFIVSCAIGGRMIMNKVASISGMDVAKKVVENVVFQIDRILDEPKEDQEQRIKKIKAIVNKLKPIIREINGDSVSDSPQKIYK